jgi:ubiquinone/menaquinone biosynthesis C-methylase UbiE
MSASGAEWLTRKSREREEQPRKLLTALQVQPHQHVCDFGCGNGYYTLQLARQVGPRGKVFAVDIQQEMLTLLEQRARPRGLSNIEPVLATLTDPRLPPRQLDLVLMVDVYHELSEPAVILQAIYASLNATGRVAIVEFREEDPQVPILPLHKMSQAQVMKELSANNFKLVRQFDGLPWQHVLFFARQDSIVAAQQLIPWQSEESNRAKQELRQAEP